MPGVGQGERGALGPTSLVGTGGFDESVALQPAEGRVDLPEREWFRLRERGVVSLLEFVPVLRATREEAEKHMRRGHAAHYSPSE